MVWRCEMRGTYQVQISEPKTSLPLHSSCTRTVSSFEGSDKNAGGPKMYTTSRRIGQQV